MLECETFDGRTGRWMNPFLMLVPSMCKITGAWTYNLYQGAWAGSDRFHGGEGCTITHTVNSDVRLADTRGAKDELLPN